MTRPARKPAPSAPPAPIQPGPVVDVALSEIVGVDPCNERRAPTSAESVRDLAADIAARGLVNPLILRGLPGRYTVLVGGRRWRALTAIFPSHQSTRARVFAGDDEAAAALSRAENIERVDPHPLEEADSVALSAERGGVAAVARAQGKSERWVRERIALSRLPDAARKLWLEGAIAAPQARALAAFEPAAAQALLDRANARAILADPRAIRAALAPRGVPADAAAARYVGVDAYVAAGGALHEDLFDGPTLLLDAELLLRLERARLAAEADRICEAEGWGHALFEPGEATRRVAPKFLEDEIEALEAYEGAGDHVQAAEIVRRASLRAVSQSERARYGVYVGLDSEGRLDIERGVIVDGGAIPAPATPVDEAGGSHPGPAASEIDAGSEAAEDVPAARAPRAASPARAAELSAEARRHLDRAVSRAAAELIGEATAGDAMRVALAALVAKSTALRLSMEKGPGGRGHALLSRLAKLDFAPALVEAALADDDAVENAFAELIASAVDVRRGGDGEARGLFKFLAAIDDAETVRLRFSNHFDYAAYFAAAGRAACLDALRACGGKAAESERAWMKDEQLAEQAALMARAARWAPEFLGVNA